METGQIDRFHVSRGAQGVSHLLFADDMLVFLNGKKNSIHSFMNLLHTYENASGQQVNVSKSGFVVSSKMAVTRKNLIQEWTGFQHMTLPLQYLGCPLFKVPFQRKKKMEYFQELISNTKKRIEGWKLDLMTIYP